MVFNKKTRLHKMLMVKKLDIAIIAAIATVFALALAIITAIATTWQ